MKNNDWTLKLPLSLEDGLLMRWAGQDDIEALSNFNIQIHSPNQKKPAPWLGEWTRDLMSGKHPTTKSSDFTVVVDQNNGGKIVSSLNLISQTWTYAGIPFGVGRIELVGTDSAYRRRGLVSKQMAVIHLLSESRGESVQAITGIPWYYRQFGYEMTINLGGGCKLYWNWAENKKEESEQDLTIRVADENDIPLLSQLYDQQRSQDLIKHERNAEIWKYGMNTAHKDSPAYTNCHVIQNPAGEAIAYAEIRQWGTGFAVREMAVLEGQSWRQIGLFLVDWLKNQAVQLNTSREDPITNIFFNLGETHPIYEALRDKLEKKNKPYAWYIRIPDLFEFITLISPALEKRLSESEFAGYSGSLRLNFYRHTMCLGFHSGKLDSIDQYVPKYWEDADALFPNLTFLQLLFGYRSFKELDYAYADCYALKDEAGMLINALFPRHPSDISPLN